MAKILREGIHSAEFLVWEAHQNYTRDNAWIDSPDNHLVGEPFLKVKATGAIVPVTAANVAGLAATKNVVANDDDVIVPAVNEFFGFLIDEVIGDDESTVDKVQRAFLTNGPATINPAHINFPAGADAPATAALKATILAAAAAKQIKVA